LDNKIKDKWLKWMNEKHIPDVISTRCFLRYEIFNVIKENKVNTQTFVINYFFDDWKNYELYQQKFLHQLQKEHTELFKGRFSASRSILKQL